MKDFRRLFPVSPFLLINWTKTERAMNKVNFLFLQLSAIHSFLNCFGTLTWRRGPKDCGLSLECFVFSFGLAACSWLVMISSKSRYEMLSDLLVLFCETAWRTSAKDTLSPKAWTLHLGILQPRIQFCDADSLASLCRDVERMNE